MTLFFMTIKLIFIFTIAIKIKSALQIPLLITLLKITIYVLLNNNFNLQFNK